MKIVYMGTPDFAVPPLEALVRSGYEVAAVVTQPDKPKGRGKTLMPTPVKEEAMKHEIPVYQPVKVRDPEFVETLTGLAPDIIVVAAFGQIIPKTILDLPKYGCILVCVLTLADCELHHLFRKNGINLKLIKISADVNFILQSIIRDTWNLVSRR